MKTGQILSLQSKWKRHRKLFRYRNHQKFTLLSLCGGLSSKPLQIIELKEEKDGEEMLFKFHLNQESLEEIMNKIPQGMKVSVVSVVGNFRTGKSFLLTFMLRYLRNRYGRH
jgi:hypothetical protein